MWRTLLRSYAHVTRRLETELTAEHALALSWYDVLVQLVEAPERRLRMTELADRVLLSRSGLTRLVDRMVAEGLVRREPSATDARGFYTVLTDKGFERLRAASSTHLRGIREHMVSKFTAAELAELGRLLGRLESDGG